MKGAAGLCCDVEGYGGHAQVSLQLRKDWTKTEPVFPAPAVSEAGKEILHHPPTPSSGGTRWWWLKSYCCFLPALCSLGKGSLWQPSFSYWQQGAQVSLAKLIPPFHP